MEKRVREVDGLRAIALLGVLLYHSRIHHLCSGGFLGVDIFFVISGYVITISLYRQFQNESFSFQKFLIRRIHRLLPSFFCVVFLTNVLCSILFIESQRRNSGKLSLSSIFSFSNIFLWMQSDYFDSRSIEKPYLHTWSLSLEWQFYLTWSLFSSILFRKVTKTSKQKFVLISLALTSISLTHLVLAKFPSAAFFNIPFRYYEFLCGAIPAWFKFKGESSKTDSVTQMSPGSTKKSFLSIIIILLFFTFFKENLVPFPGISALPICVATVLLIEESAGTSIGSLLTHTFLQWLGSISYSVYLVHWPLLVILESIMFFKSTEAQRLCVLVLSVALGYFLHSYVEVPFQYKQDKSEFLTESRKKLFVTALFFAVLLQSIMMIFKVDELFESRIHPDLQEIYKNSLALRSERGPQMSTRNNLECYFNKHYRDNRNFDACNPPTETEIALIGDSHAGDLWFALNEGLPNNAVVQITGNACSLGKSRLPRHCLTEDKVLEMLETRRPRLKAVVLCNSWRPVKYLFRRRLEELVRKIRDMGIHKIILVGPRPSYNISPLDIMEMKRIENVTDLQKSIQEHKKSPSSESMETVNTLTEFSRAQSIHFIDVNKIFCDLKRSGSYNCNILAANGKYLLYTDQSHFNRMGASLVANEIVPLVKQ